MAIACLADRAPCFPWRMCSISSRTNSPACVLGRLPSAAFRRARRIVFFSGIKKLLSSHDGAVPPSSSGAVGTTTFFTVPSAFQSQSSRACPQSTVALMATRTKATCLYAASCRFRYAAFDAMPRGLLACVEGSVTFFSVSCVV